MRVWKKNVKKEKKKYLISEGKELKEIINKLELKLNEMNKKRKLKKKKKKRKKRKKK
jgi:hypothetical protein